MSVNGEGVGDGVAGPMPGVVASAPVREISWSRVCPWLRLGRAVSLGLDAWSLLMAAFGIIAMRLGWSLLAWIFGSSGWVVSEGIGISTLGGWLPTPVAPLPIRAATPWLTPMSPFLAFGQFGGRGSLAYLHMLLSGLWGLLVWATVGGAIARRGLVKVANGRTAGAGEALRFALRRVPSLVGGPLTALGGFAFFVLLCSLLGLLYQLGTFGETLAGVLLFIPLAIGVVLALIAVGLAAGWPLMVATVAAEGEDSFDAMSRSYGYVYQRPGRFAFYVAVSWLLGMVGLLVVTFAADLVLHLAAWALSFGGPDIAIVHLFQGRPVNGSATLPDRIHSGWVEVVGLLAGGYAYSFFWSAVAVIYLLLRKDVDGAEWDDVYEEGETEEFLPPAPVVSKDTTAPSALN